jgi:hypothetical protein
MSTERFLGDPVLDRMMKVLLSLSQEVYVLRDRLGVVESLLEQRRVISRADLEGHVPGPQDQSRILAERDAYIERVLSPLTDAADGEPADRD